MKYFATETERALRRASRVVGLFTIAALISAFGAPAPATGFPGTGSGGAGTVKEAEPISLRPDRTYGHVPLHFHLNDGQAPESVRFMARGNGYALYLTADEALFMLRRGDAEADLLRMRVVGANEDPVVEGQGMLPAKVNYMRGSDQAAWKTGIDTYARAVYREVYPGIDMVYYGTDRRELEYDFVVAPGVDPDVIRVQFDGADRVLQQNDGSLLLEMKRGDVQVKAPYVYQEIDGVRVEVASRYVRTGDAEVGFEIGAYDETRTLVIDPIVVYSTYLGGSGEDVVSDVFVDADGHAYVTGFTTSGNFPTANPIQFNNFFPGVDRDVFVTKFAPDGQSLVFSTYIGGSFDEEGTGITVDQTTGEIYVTGFTTSGDFPVENAWQASHGGIPGVDRDVFLTKIADDGASLAFSTYLGSGNDDVANDVAIDPANNNRIYIVGTTRSGSIGIPMQRNTHSDGGTGAISDAFAARFNLDGELRWFQFVGGLGQDEGNDIAVGPNGDPHVVGTTSSNSTTDGFPITPGAIQSLLSGGTDAFVARLAATPIGPVATPPLYVTYLGGTSDDLGLGIALDADENAYVVGQTESPDFSAAGQPNVHQNVLNGAADGFLVKLTAVAGSPLLYSTYIGGSGLERANGVAVDSRNRAHVVGTTTSADFAATNGTALNGANDAFLAILTANASALDFATYHGGDATEQGLAVAVDPLDNSYIAGLTASGSGFPTASFQATFGGGGSDGFVAKYGIKADLKMTKTVSNMQPLVTDQVTYTLTVTNDGPDDVITFSVTDVIPAGVVVVSVGPGCVEAGGIVTCDGGFLAAGTSTSFTITVEVRASITIQNCATVHHPYVDPNTNNNTHCVTIAPREQVTFWQNANQEAGSVTALAFTTQFPVVQNDVPKGTLFAGTDGGGVYRSTDGGDNWHPTCLVPTGDNRYVRGIVVDGREVFVITFETTGSSWTNGLWYSPDLLEEGTCEMRNHGSTPSQREMLSIVMNKFNQDGPARDLYIGTLAAGVVKSTNSGAFPVSYTSFNAGLTNLTVRSLALIEGPFPALGCPSGDFVYAGTHGGGVFRSCTSTAGWASINGGLANYVVHALWASSSGDLYAGTNQGIFKTSNPTAATPTWTQETLIPPAFFSDPSFMEQPVVRSFTENVDGDLFAGTDGDYVLRKLDGASDWEWPSVLDPSGNPQHYIGLNSKTILALLAVEELDHAVFAGTQDKGVHRSEDNGTTWEQVSNETINAVIQAIVFRPDGGQLFAGTFGFGILMSDDFNVRPWVNWTQVNKGLGNHWVYSLAAVHRPTGPQTFVFAGTWNGGIYRSTDSGENWMFSGLPHRIVYDIAVQHHDVNNKVIFAATDRGEVARSVDFGLTWQEIGVATTAIWSLGIDPSTPNVLYAGTFGAGIFKSTNGGFTWVKSGMTTGHVFDFAFGTHPLTSVPGIFAATATGVKFSSDAGATWSDLSTGLTVPDTRTIEVHPLDPSLLVAGTWGGGVFTFDVASRSWIRDGLPQMPVTAFAIHPLTGEMFTSTQSGDLFRKPYAGSSVSTENSEREVPGAFELAQNYPNPFNPVTTISFSLPETQNVRLAVFDALGRVVGVLVDRPLAAGRHEIAFEARDLPSGIYFYRIETPNVAQTRSMILMK